MSLQPTTGANATVCFQDLEERLLCQVASRLSFKDQTILSLTEKRNLTIVTIAQKKKEYI